MRTHARGVLFTDGSRLNADVVLANADLPYVYQHLLPEDGMVKALLRKRYSCSAISFFWGVDKKYETLGPHTLFLADDYRENFQSIDRNLDLPANPSLYVHAPARLDASMAPPGQDTLTAIVPVGHLSDNGRPGLERTSGRRTCACIPPAPNPGHYRPGNAHQVRRDIYSAGVAKTI